jgi:hypothetical protein
MCFLLKGKAMKTIDEKVEYHMRVSDKAHELYQKRGGRYILQWQGAAKGYSSERVGIDVLWKDCMQQAKEIIDNENN